MTSQTSNTVLMIRPANFEFNPETYQTNKFKTDLNLSEKEIKKKE